MNRRGKRWGRMKLAIQLGEEMLMGGNKDNRTALGKTRDDNILFD